MSKTFPILLVEDDLVDVMSVRRALRELKTGHRLMVAGNGEEALSQLRDRQCPRPGIILLDLNMPRMNGIDFLKVVKNDERLRRLPVVVLTTSREQKDLVQSYNLGAAGYMIKPVDYPGFVEVVRNIEQYWNQSEMPP